MMNSFRHGILRRLLRWHGWVHDPHSRRARVWRAATVALQSGDGPTERFDAVLPRLPLPSIEETLATFIASVDPLLDSDGRDEVRSAARSFADSALAVELQERLHRRRASERNWVSKYWETYAYLSDRRSLLHSAGYALDAAQLPRPGITQTERAALLIGAVLAFRRRLVDGDVAPQHDRGVAPLCMRQLRRYFGTVRQPGIGCDSITHYNDASCVIVLVGGHYFEIDVRQGSEDRAIGYHELVAVLDDIRLLAATLPAAPPLGALTFQERDQWAAVRARILDDGGRNADTIQRIERGLLVVAFDDQSPAGLDELTRAILHGDGTNRWLDKSTEIVVFANGRAGALMEHSWGDGESVTLGWEEMLLRERAPSATAPVVSHPPTWTHLGFDVAAGSALDADLSAAKAAARTLIDDADVCAVEMPEVGAAAMKALRCSPDSLVQMALQLAYARTHPERGPCLTYETATTRLFAGGRTECIRPTSDASVAFVAALTESRGSATELAQLLRSAIDSHRKYVLRAKLGRGCDRHLLGLLVEAQLSGHQVDLFNTRAWHLPFEVATSQSPIRQTASWTEVASCRGVGFLPTSPTGYGVSYAFVGDHRLNITVGALRHSGETSARRFADAAGVAVIDLLALLAAASSAVTGVSRLIEQPRAEVTEGPLIVNG